MGALRDLLRAEHQQEERDARPRHRSRTGPAAPVDRDLRRHRREQHAAGARADGLRRRCRPRHPARCRHGPDAGLRARRPVARRPGLRLRHRGRRRADVDDRATRTRTRSRPTAWATRTPAPTRCAACSSRWSTAARTGEGVLVEASMVDAALNVAAEQVVEHSAYGALLERRREPRADRRPAEPVPHGRRRRRRAARRLGRDRRRDRRSVAGPPRRARSPRVGDGPGADDRGRTATAPRRHRPPPVELVRRPERRRDRRLPLGRGRPGREGDAAARAADLAPAAVPRLLRGGRPSRHGNRPAQHPAVPVLTRPRPVPPSPGARCWASTPTRCCETSGSPTTRWPSSPTRA